MNPCVQDRPPFIPSMARGSSRRTILRAWRAYRLLVGNVMRTRGTCTLEVYAYRFNRAHDEVLRGQCPVSRYAHPTVAQIRAHVDMPSVAARPSTPRLIFRLSPSWYVPALASLYDIHRRPGCSHNSSEACMLPPLFCMATAPLC